MPLAPTPPASEFVVDFPTLGFLGADWIAQHCVIPDGFHVGEPFELTDDQLRFTVCHYRVRPKARRGQLSTAFEYRRSQYVRPQKYGKSPSVAALVCLEGVGPAVFAGWARGGEEYRCADFGCGCGWVYVYEPGEPMGVPWPTPLIQLTANSEDQVENVLGALRPMINLGPLAEVIPRTGEEFIRLPGGGRIDAVSASARSRLGQRVTFVPQDETGVWTAANGMVAVAETQRRGLAGMGGRAIETTNAWDPSENSVAQRTFESRAKDVYRDMVQAPAGLSYTDKRERRRIHRAVYAGSWWVDLDAIEAEAAELLEKDPGQAERFFGNRLVPGAGSWLDRVKWARRAAPRPVPDGTLITLGFDGSDVDDWTGIRCDDLLAGYQFTPTYGPDRQPCVWNPADYGGQVPRLEVDAAVRELYDRFQVTRGYFDPPYWETEIDTWAELLGEKKVVRWYTSRQTRMHPAAERLLTDVTKADSGFTHDGCGTTADHVANARKSARPGGRYVLVKASPAQKIDLVPCSILSHQAAGDAIAAGENVVKRRKYVYTA